MRSSKQAVEISRRLIKTQPSVLVQTQFNFRQT
jgi:hypothetical protein